MRNFSPLKIFKYKKLFSKCNLVKLFAEHFHIHFFCMFICKKISFHVMCWIFYQSIKIREKFYVELIKIENIQMCAAFLKRIFKSSNLKISFYILYFCFYACMQILKNLNPQLFTNDVSKKYLRKNLFPFYLFKKI